MKSNSSAPLYDSDRLSKVHAFEECFINDLFGDERQYPEHLEPINETYEDDQMDSNIIFDDHDIEVNSGENKFALGYKNPCFLKKAVKHNPKLYNVDFHNNPFAHAYVYDIEETIELAALSRERMKAKEIKLVDYTKLNNLYDHFFTQKEVSKEQKYFSNTSTTVVVPSKKIF
ncbi:hypothetical protein Tco_0318336 [Tanacetum coccineum]